MKNKAYTLAEVLVAIGIIGVASALCLPLANKLKPDETKMIFLRTYDDMQQTILEVANDQNIYPLFEDDSNDRVYHPLLNTDTNVISDISCLNRICKVLANAYGKEGGNCSNIGHVNAEKASEITDNPSFQLKNGVDVWVTTLKNDENSGKNKYITAIIFDTNGKGRGSDCVYTDDCKNPDQFKFLVDYDGQMYPADGMSKFYLQNKLSTRKELPPETISTEILSEFPEEQ